MHRCDVLGADAMCDVCAICYSVLHGTDSVCTVCGAGVNVLSVTMVTLDNTSLVTARSSPGNHSASVTERRIGSGAFTLLDPCRLCVGEEVKFLQTPETMLFNLPNNPISCLLNHHFLIKMTNPEFLIHITAFCSNPMPMFVFMIFWLVDSFYDVLNIECWSPVCMVHTHFVS